MKTINSFIVEKLKLGKDTKVYCYYKFYPKDFDELRSLLEQLLEERGKDADLNDIDVSQVTSFGDEIKTGEYECYWGLFYGLDPHNIDISQWDVSKVKNMCCAFYKCKKFNCDLSKWNVSKVEDMGGMFCGCENFNCDLSDWDISNVKNMQNIFYKCNSLKNKPSWYKI